jgi:HSP20 family protein
MWEAWRPFTLDYSLVPHTDIYEEKDQLIMKTELPGIAKKDLDVSLEGDRLTIKAENKEEVKEDATHHTRERYYGQYFRSVTLPYPVKEDKISATFDNGVLELRLQEATTETSTEKELVRG